MHKLELLYLLLLEEDPSPEHVNDPNISPTPCHILPPESYPPLLKQGDQRSKYSTDTQFLLPVSLSAEDVWPRLTRTVCFPLQYLQDQKKTEMCARAVGVPQVHDDDILTSVLPPGHWKAINDIRPHTVLSLCNGQLISAISTDRWRVMVVMVVLISTLERIPCLNHPPWHLKMAGPLLCLQRQFIGSSCLVCGTKMPCVNYSVSFSSWKGHTFCLFVFYIKSGYRV